MPTAREASVQHMVTVIPEPGQMVEVRRRLWSVTEVNGGALEEDCGTSFIAQHVVSLSSLEDDSLGEDIEVVWELEPGRLRRLVGVIRGLQSVEGSGSILSLDFQVEAADCVNRLVYEWKKNTELEPTSLALAMEAAAHVHEEDSEDHSIEIVWTGPRTEFIPVRRTEQVLLELIRAARKSVFLVSFVVQGIPTVEEALKDAMAKNVVVSLLVERSKEHGGILSFDLVDPLRESLPGASIYTWPPENREVDDTGRRGSVHAKCAVADGRIAFVTSANLTGGGSGEEHGVGPSGHRREDSSVYREALGGIDRDETDSCDLNNSRKGERGMLKIPIVTPPERESNG